MSVFYLESRKKEKRIWQFPPAESEPRILVSRFHGMTRQSRQVHFSHIGNSNKTIQYGKLGYTGGQVYSRFDGHGVVEGFVGKSPGPEKRQAPHLYLYKYVVQVLYVLPLSLCPATPPFSRSHHHYPVFTLFNILSYCVRKSSSCSSTLKQCLH